jgi:membrane protease YdiL (CAAX protease family)
MSQSDHGDDAEPVPSMFAAWSSDFTVQVLLSAVGLMLLGAVLWSVFVEPPEPERSAWNGWSAWDVGLIFLAWFSLAALGRLVWQILMHELHARAGVTVRRLTRNLGFVAAQVLAMLVAVWGFGLYQHGVTWSLGLGLRPMTAGWVTVTLAVGLVVGALPGILAVVVTRRGGVRLTSDQIEFLVPDEENEDEEQTRKRRRAARVGLSYPVGALGMIVLAGLAVPFAEEALFRGVLHRWLRGDGSFLPATSAVLLSSLAFGLAHYRWDRTVVVVTFFFGILLAVLYDLGGSLWVPILLHAMVNGPKIALVYLDRAGWFDWLSPAAKP